MKQTATPYSHRIGGLLATLLLLCCTTWGQNASVNESPVDSGGWLNYEADIPATGYYLCSISAANSRQEVVRVWLEDLNENQMYERISEDFLLQKNTGDYQVVRIPHCPLRAGKHWLRIHFSKGGVAISTVQLRAETNKN
jgi:hypothetical protein